jgi:hypothetical protein
LKKDLALIFSGLALVVIILLGIFLGSCPFFKSAPASDTPAGTFTPTTPSTQGDRSGAVKIVNLALTRPKKELDWGNKEVAYLYSRQLSQEEQSVIENIIGAIHATGIG